MKIRSRVLILLKSKLPPASLALLVCLSSVHGWAQQNAQQQMRGLDDQVQEIKSDVLSIGQELNRLEEKLLYPSGTQVSIFITVAKGDQMRGLDDQVQEIKSDVLSIGQ